MSISIFYLPYYKDMIHVTDQYYLSGKAPTCKENELEEFLPIWRKMISGKYPGSVMNLGKRILNKEYSMYPIVFLDSHYWPQTGETKPHGYTTVHVVQKQQQDLENCKSYDHKYIDRETGVIIFEKTTLHDGAVEPDYRYWFYEKDSRPKLPENILKESFQKVDIMKHEKAPGFFLTIEKYKEMPDYPEYEKHISDLDACDYSYEKRYGYLDGEHIRKMIKEKTFSKSFSQSCELIEWDDSWNFVIRDEFGSIMFRVEKKDAEEFLERNNLFC